MGIYSRPIAPPPPADLPPRTVLLRLHSGRSYELDRPRTIKIEPGAMIPEPQPPTLLERAARWLRRMTKPRKSPFTAE